MTRQIKCHIIFLGLGTLCAKILWYLLSLLNSLLLPPSRWQSGRNSCNAAAFASFKKYPLVSGLSEYRQAGTEPKEAAYAVTDFNSYQNSNIKMILVPPLRIKHLIL